MGNIVHIISISEWLSILSLFIALLSVVATVIIAIVSGVYTVKSNTKRFEYSEAYRKEIMDWYEKTVKVIVRLYSGDNVYEMQEKSTDLAELSALIEVGRFYFPNIHSDKFGKSKPPAYRGNRRRVLDYLVFIYMLAAENSISKVEGKIRILERQFTSYIFAFINPYKRLKNMSQHTDFVLDSDTDFTYDDIIANTKKWTDFSES